MNEWRRPDPVPYFCERVVLASEKIEPGLKLVYGRHIWLDRKGEPQGAFISAAELGRQLAMTEATIERHRSTLAQYGLLECRRRGPKPAYWYPRLPPGCIPAMNNTAEILRCAALLDQHLARLLGDDLNDGSDHVPNNRSPQGPNSYSGQEQNSRSDQDRNRHSGHGRRFGGDRGGSSSVRGDNPALLKGKEGELKKRVATQQDAEEETRAPFGADVLDAMDRIKRRAHG